MVPTPVYRMILRGTHYLLSLKTTFLNRITEKGPINKKAPILYSAMTTQLPEFLVTPHEKIRKQKSAVGTPFITRNKYLIILFLKTIRRFNIFSSTYFNDHFNFLSVYIKQMQNYCCKKKPVQISQFPLRTS